MRQIHTYNFGCFFVVPHYGFFSSFFMHTCSAQSSGAGGGEGPVWEGPREQVRQDPARWEDGLRRCPMGK